MWLIRNCLKQSESWSSLAFSFASEYDIREFQKNGKGFKWMEHTSVCHEFTLFGEIMITVKTQLSKMTVKLIKKFVYNVK